MQEWPNRRNDSNAGGPGGNAMAFLGFVVLVLIAMTIAANMNPEGPALVILLIWACPALFGGLFMVLNQNAKTPARIGGALIMLLGLWLMSLFFGLL